MIRKRISKVEAIILGIISLVVLFGAYSALSWDRHRVNPTDTTLPSLWDMADAFARVCRPQGMEKKVWLYEDSVATFLRLFYGMTFSCVISVFLGILMGCYERLAAFFLPVLGFFTRTPATAMLAVLFATVGSGEALFLAIIAIGVLPNLTQSVYLAARYDVKDEEAQKAYSLGLSSDEVIVDVVFMKSLPKIIDSIRLQVGPALVCLIAAELLVGQVGFGYRLRIQSRLLHMDVVYIYLIVLSLFGLVTDRSFIWVRQKLCGWFDKKQG